MTNVLIIGDSIAYGIDDETGNGWAGYLREKLKPFFPGKFRFYNRGIGMDSSIDVQHRLGSEIAAIQPDYIFIAVGVNDTQILLPGKEQSFSLLRSSRTWHKILAIASSTKAKVIIISPLPVDDTSPVIVKDGDISGVTAVDYKTDRIVEYCLMLEKACSYYDVKYFDLFSLWQKMDYPRLLPDGLHPNVEGHRIIMDQIFDLLQQHELLPKIV